MLFQCSFYKLPGHAIHSLLVDGRHQEADWWHNGLISWAVQNLPLEGLWVIDERALVALMHGDLLKEILVWACSTSKRWTCDSEWGGMNFTSICLKSHTAWMGSLPLKGVVGSRGFSWMMDLALLFRLAMSDLNSFSCSLSSCGQTHSVSLKLLINRTLFLRSKH